MIPWSSTFLSPCNVRTQLKIFWFLSPNFRVPKPAFLFAHKISLHNGPGVFHKCGRLCKVIKKKIVKVSHPSPSYTCIIEIIWVYATNQFNALLHSRLLSSSSEWCVGWCLPSLQPLPMEYQTPLRTFLPSFTSLLCCILQSHFRVPSLRQLYSYQLSTPQFNELYNLPLKLWEFFHGLSFEIKITYLYTPICIQFHRFGSLSVLQDFLFQEVSLERDWFPAALAHIIAFWSTIPSGYIRQPYENGCSRGRGWSLWRRQLWILGTRSICTTTLDSPDTVWLVQGEASFTVWVGWKPSYQSCLYGR